MAKKTKETKEQDDKSAEQLTKLLSHYDSGVDDMDTRRTRKNGWNQVIDAYMGKLPDNWPYTSRVTDPRIRTTILEKTARLLNAKLKGRLLPREGTDVIKARINNALLEYQWDNASNGGSMLEKVAQCDQNCRIFGAAFVYVYWDVKKDCNEIKVIDPRDIFIDPSANHIKNAKWVQVREFTTLDALESRGIDTASIKTLLKTTGSTPLTSNSDLKSTSYESEVKLNRGLSDKTGEDIYNPIVEYVTEYTNDGKMSSFLPKYGHLCVPEKNIPYKHATIPVAMLRYYPLGDDVYGESEVESVIPVQRAINAFLCGTIDELNLAQRPPIKIVPTQVRIETIEYGPGAKWLMNSLDAVQEFPMAANVMNNFQGIYSTLVASFETAMGGQSLGVSNVGPMQGDKTATEVASLEKQQNNRDQYNQMYLGEFLKDIMMMWLSNNKQYLWDDPTKQHHVLKIVGKDNMKDFQALRLDAMDIPDEALQEIQGIIEQSPNGVSDDMINQIMQDVAVPMHPVVMNPKEQNPANYEIKPKLDVKSSGEADLYMTKDDFNGEYDYVPDVKSMAAGAGIMMQNARTRFMDRVMNPQVQAMLQTQGEMADIKELLVADAEDAGYKDAQGLFKTIQQPAGAGIAQPGQPPLGAPGMPGMGQIPQTLPNQPLNGGIPQPAGQGFPG